MRIKKLLITPSVLKLIRKTYKVAIGIMTILIALLFFGKNGESTGKMSLNITAAEVNSETMADVEPGDEAISKDESNSETVFQESDNIENTSTDNPLICDISGEVINPGVYKLEAGARLIDLIELANGLTENANIDKINRARFLHDGEKVYIPGFEDAYYEEYIESSGRVDSIHKININTASSEELETLPGIGPVTAKRIIDYRNDYGKFSEIDELKNVPGIGDKTFEKLAENVTV